MDTKGPSNYIRKKRKFRFEAMWVGEEKCQLIMRDAWDSLQFDHSMSEVMQYVDTSSKMLKIWNKNKVGNVEKNIRKAKDNLERL